MDVSAFYHNKTSHLIHRHNKITATDALWHVHGVYIVVPGASVAIKLLWS